MKVATKVQCQMLKSALSRESGGRNLFINIYHQYFIDLSDVGIQKPVIGTELTV